MKKKRNRGENKREITFTLNKHSYDLLQNIINKKGEDYIINNIINLYLDDVQKRLQNKKKEEYKGYA